MKIDYKFGVIVILFIMVTFLMYGKFKVIDETKKDIEVLHDANDSLLIQNDSLDKIIEELNLKIDTTTLLLKVNKIKIDESDSIIKRLKNENSKINNRVRNMYANDVANSFSNYLNNKPKGKSVSK